MNVSQLESIAKYITNAQGEKVEVIIPIEIWHDLLETFAPAADRKDDSLSKHYLEQVDSKLNSVAGEDGDLKLVPANQHEPIATVPVEMQEFARTVKVGENRAISNQWDEEEIALEEIKDSIDRTL